MTKRKYKIGSLFLDTIRNDVYVLCYTADETFRVGLVCLGNGRPWTTFVRCSVAVIDEVSHDDLVRIVTGGSDINEWLSSNAIDITIYPLDDIVGKDNINEVISSMIIDKVPGIVTGIIRIVTNEIEDDKKRATAKPIFDSRQLRMERR